jgi:putative tryptophan/tyrosine transport system substrate-binding protein
MDRRQFIRMTASAVVAIPVASRAEPAGRTLARVGYLGNSDARSVAKEVQAFRHGLDELGWIEGRTITVDFRWAEGDLVRLPALVQELLRLRADVLVVSGVQAVQAAQQATKQIPIVIGAVFVDPVRAGFAASLAHPGGNITGLAAQYDELVTKQVQLLAEMLPGLARLAMLRYEGPSTGATKSAAAEAIRAAERVGARVQMLEVGNLSDLQAAFRSANEGRAQALHVLPSPFFNANRAQLVNLAARFRVPALYEFSDYTRDGGLMSYGVSLPAMFRRAASYVDRILKGAKPSEIPIERPAKFELVINLKTAKALGLAIRHRCCCGRIRSSSEPPRLRGGPGSSARRAARGGGPADGQDPAHRLSRYGLHRLRRNARPTQGLPGGTARTRLCGGTEHRRGVPVGRQ